MEKQVSGYISTKLRAEADAFAESDVIKILLEHDPQRAIRLAYICGHTDARNQWLDWAVEQGFIQEWSETLPEGAELADGNKS